MYMRHIYREKFGLTAEEMDNENLLEVQLHFKIWKLEEMRQKDDNKNSSAPSKPAQ